MSLVEHLGELRKRIVISLAAFAVGLCLSYLFGNRILDLLIAPLGDRELITLSPAESFMTAFKVFAYAGVIMASPVIIYQIWAFVAPGLKTKERRVVLTATAFTSALFLVGIVFAWIIVLPRVLNFLLNYQSGVFNQQVQAAKYFSFVAMFLLGFGIMFETPVMIITLVRMGVVDARTLGKHRKYAVLIGAVASAALTPTDVFSMMSMFIPFLVLFEFSIHLGKLVQRRKRKREAAASVDDGTDIGETAS
jgi:sec-independent protein translocase protein TatC